MTNFSLFLLGVRFLLMVFMTLNTKFQVQVGLGTEQLQLYAELYTIKYSI
jgi:hypothetical protein